MESCKAEKTLIGQLVCVCVKKAACEDNGNGWSNGPPSKTFKRSQRSFIRLPNRHKVPLLLLQGTIASTITHFFPAAYVMTASRWHRVHLVQFKTECNM